MRAALLLCFFAACHVEKAPETVDEAVRALWPQYDKKDEEVIAFAKVAHEVMKGDRHKTEPLKGRVTSLAEDVLLMTPSEAKNATTASGIYIYGFLDCKESDVERIATAPNQKELFPGLYDDYTREYFADRDAFLNGETSRLQYQTTMKASVLGTSYTTISPVEARRVSAPVSQEVPAGTMLMLKQYIPSPATFKCDGELKQDYQVELFYPLPTGGVMHLYGIWREMRIGGFTVEDDITVALILNGLIDYDRRMEEHCKKGD